MNNYIEQNIDSINSIAHSLTLVKEKQKIVIYSQQTIMGFVKNMSLSLEKLMETIDCLEVTLELERWTQSVERTVRDLMQFV